MPVNMGIPRRKSAGVNLLDLKPERRIEWEESEDGRLVLLVPRFRNRFLVKWIVPRLRSPYIRVRLDELGSAVWNCCDGKSTCMEIAEKMREKYGDAVEPVYDRVGIFVRRLYLDRFVDLKS